MDVEKTKASEIMLLNLFGSEDENVENHTTDVVMLETKPLCDNESSHSELKWLQQDEPIALWMKWRGKWQAGIKCARADWPLMTLRGKPTHDRKTDFVIFFPHAKNYSWSDMKLVRPINELPEPIAYESHKIGVNKVKDVTVARGYIMRKVILEMFNIVDQFNFEAVVESAKDVIVWKEFAMEATRSKSYQDLGNMLVELRTMILQRYIDPIWLKNSFPSWVQKCKDAVNAEIVELLNEEFESSIQWNEVKSTSDSSTQPMVLSEWKTWKHDIKKWFSLSHRSKRVFNSDVQASRKRAKHETRRRGETSNASKMESHTSPQGLMLSTPENGLVLWDASQTREANALLEMESHTSPQGLTSTENTNVMRSTPHNGLVLWDASQLMETREAANALSEPQVMKKPFGSARKSQQCKAFIKSRGRQCARWASEGDVLCCTHSPSRFTTKSAKKKSSLAVDTPLCGGVTVIGTNCKHRSLPGSLFCKKHRPKTLEATQSPALVLSRRPEIPSSHGNTSFFTEMLSQDDNLCIGYFSENSYVPCNEFSRKHSLYCKQHLPKWLMCATNRMSRIISKEVFLDLLKGCSSREEKLTLHQACELFYKLFKRLLSLGNSVPMDVQIESVISEASREAGVGEFLFKIVCNEKERLARIWGFSESASESESPNQLLAITNGEETRDEEKSSFSGFACAICLDTFGNRRILETHVEERHHVQFVDKCMLLQCLPCGSHFGDKEQLLVHVQALHPSECELINQESSQEPELQIVVASQNEESTSSPQKFACSFCGLTFKLLPDLGRHHQAEHMGVTPVPSGGPNKLKESLGTVLSSKVRNAKLGPNKLDILTAARSACCRLNFERSLKSKFGMLSKGIYLRAAKLCGENDVQVQWDQEGYICSKGCKPSKDKNLLRPLLPQQENDRSVIVLDMGEHSNKELEVDESHAHHFSKRPFKKTVVLCSDISFGKEPVPICCVVDEDLLNSEYEKPWESFTYVTKPVLNTSMYLVKEMHSLQLKCGCHGSVCSPLTCDHVYLFGNDFEEARDIYGRSMKHSFPYDDKERIILEEGYPVYECNELCGCPRACTNRVLQKGIRVKLEVFRTESKGWGLRACENILRGTFVCEYIGEVLGHQEANKRRNKYGKEGRSYILDIDASINDIGRFIGGEPDYAIDATTHGNISRFITHSCSPNLVTRQVIVESMESPLTHIGLYASIDIAAGEEITRDYGHRSK